MTYAFQTDASGRLLYPEQYVRALIEHDPDTPYQFLLSRHAVEATCIPLLPQTSPRRDVWWQLPEADRHTFREVYFHTMVDAVKKRRLDPRHTTVSAAWAWPCDTEKKVVLLWLRWAAVRQAKSEGLTWPNAYKAARNRLKGTLAHGEWSTMKAAHVSVARILKAPADRQEE